MLTLNSNRMLFPSSLWTLKIASEPITDLNPLMHKVAKMVT